MNTAVVREFWNHAMRWRGVRPDPDEYVTFDITESLSGDSFTIGAWRLRGYGKDASRRHARRRIDARELRSTERAVDVLSAATRELVLALFPVLPRNGPWRLFSRRR